MRRQAIMVVLAIAGIGTATAQDAPMIPDPDRDRDGILNDDDRCPDNKEVYNASSDDDGCPDTLLITILGLTVDSRTDQPVDAVLRVSGPGGTRQINAQGSYRLQTPAPGIYSIQAQAPGYRPETAVFYVTRGQSVRLNWILTPNS